METLGELLTPADVRSTSTRSSPTPCCRWRRGSSPATTDLPSADVKAALAARESLGCTALGHGVALPHARMAGLAQPAGAFIRTRSPLDFGAFDGKPVSCFLVLVVPAEAAEVHLKLLANAATLLNDPSFRAAIRSAAEAKDVARLFAEWRLAPD